MILYRNGVNVISYTPEYSNQKIIIAIDSSKSNTAIAVGNEYGEILADYEIDGSGSNVDVYKLVWQTRGALRILFDNADVIIVGIEDIITKKEESSKGMDIHQSRAKITAVFDNLIFFFQEYHNKMPLLINNQEWKAATLPEEYRKRTHKKGSKDYARDIGSKWANRSDDVTDVVCIFDYIMKTRKVKPIYKISEPVLSKTNYSWGIYSLAEKRPDRTKEFMFNGKYTLQQNIETISTLLSKNDEYGVVQIPIQSVPLNIIYSERLNGKYTKGTKEVSVYVKVGG